MLAIGEDLTEARDSARGSRRGLIDGVERLARRAEHLGEPAIATLLSINAALILAGMEEVALDVLNCAVSLEGQGAPIAEKGANRNGEY